MGRPAGWSRVRSWFARHPIVCLFLLTPGIPEYLGGSTPLAALPFAPGAFLLFLALNAALYTPGVLLVREATLRWRKGWPTVLLLGIAYGILEEGVALSTLYNPHSSVVGGLGAYGHWLGVNWVWASGVLMVHVAFSISLPILLLGLALPETRGRPLLSRRGVVLVAGVLSTDVLLLMAVTRFAAGFWMGLPLLAASLAAIAALIGAARVFPAAWGTPRRGSTGALGCALLGAILFPTILVGEAAAGSLRVPAPVLLAAVAAFYGAYVGLGLPQLAGAGRERARVAFAFGALLPLAIFGALGQLGVPVILGADAAFLLFFRALFRKYPAVVTSAVPLSPAARQGSSVAPTMTS